MEKSTNKKIAVIAIFSFLLTINCIAQTNNNMQAIVTQEKKTLIINLLSKKSIDIKMKSSQIFIFGDDNFGLLDQDILCLYTGNGREIKRINNIQHIIQGMHNQPFIAVRKKEQATPQVQSIFSDIPIDIFYFEAYTKEGLPISTNMDHNWYANISENMAVYAVDTSQEKNLGLNFPLNNFVKWGVCDFNGNDITSGIYEAIKPFTADRAAVKENNKWGYINSRGNSIIACEYDYAKKWKANYGIVMRNNKWGVINSSEEIILPFKYEFLEWGAEGYILFADSIEFSPGNMQLEDIARGSFWHVLNIERKETLDFNAYYIEYIEDERYKIKICENDSFFLLFDNNLQQVCTTRFQIIGSFINNFAMAKYNHKWGVINIHGEWVIEPNYDSIKGLF